MRQVTFERKQRPPPIRLGRSTESIPQYVKTPYPNQELPSVSSLPCSPSLIDDGRIYYLSKGCLRNEVLDEIADFFYTKFPSVQFHLHCSLSLLTVDEQWELCLPHPLLHENGPVKLVQAHHIYVRLLTSGPGVDEWEDVVRDFRNNILTKHNILNAAVEFTLVGGYGNISAWYPPKLDTDKLKCFFEFDYPDDPDSEVDEQESQSDLDTDAKPRPKSSTSLIGHEMLHPLPKVQVLNKTEDPGPSARVVTAVW